MKTSTDRIADILANAPPAPPLQRKHLSMYDGVSADTKAKLLLVHTAYATFGHPLEHVHF